MIKYFTIFFTLLAVSMGAVAKSHTATIGTSMGEIEVRLYDDTPLHRLNFITLAKGGYYDGLLFHRTIANFMIQAGDPTSRSAKSGEMLGHADALHTVPAEFRANYKHKKGVLAAARLGDEQNPERASSGGQFYITVAPAGHLDGQYTVFGEVIKGQSVADKISRVSVDRHDRPKNDIIITKITINETTN